MTGTLDKALRLARRKLPIFPCHLDKRPVPRDGFKAATTDPELIELWRWDDERLIGVATGIVSGLAVLDIDPRNGGDAWLKANVNRLQTRSHKTRSGGLHLLFRTDGSVRNSAGLIAPGVDIRGEGGYAIWWPAHGCPVLDFLPLRALPDWPAWLVPAKRHLDGDGSGKWRRVATPDNIAGLIRFVADSREGERNDRLFWAACRLAEIRFNRADHRIETAQYLLAAALRVGLSVEEAEATIASGLQAERRNI